MTIYDRAQGTAARLMAKFKQGTITLTRVSPGEGDPDTPWIAPAQTADVFELDATSASILVNHATAKWVDGTTILASDLVVISGPKARHIRHGGDAVAGTPQVDVVFVPGDIIGLDGRAARVVDVKRTPPTGPAIVWKLVVRGAAAEVSV